MPTQRTANQIADTIAEIAKLAAQQDDPNRNVLGVTSERLEKAKAKLAQLLTKESWPEWAGHEETDRLYTDVK